jgi:hypothetical protein
MLFVPVRCPIPLYCMGIFHQELVDIYKKETIQPFWNVDKHSSYRTKCFNMCIAIQNFTTFSFCLKGQLREIFDHCFFSNNSPWPTDLFAKAVSNID